MMGTQQRSTGRVQNVDYMDQIDDNDVLNALLEIRRRTGRPKGKVPPEGKANEAAIERSSTCSTATPSSADDDDDEVSPLPRTPITSSILHERGDNDKFSRKRKDSFASVEKLLAKMNCDYQGNNGPEAESSRGCITSCFGDPALARTRSPELAWKADSTPRCDEPFDLARMNCTLDRMKLSLPERIMCLKSSSKNDPKKVIHERLRELSESNRKMLSNSFEGDGESDDDANPIYPPTKKHTVTFASNTGDGDEKEQTETALLPSELMPMLSLVERVQAYLMKRRFDAMQLYSISALLHRIERRIQRNRINKSSEVESRALTTRNNPPDVKSVTKHLIDVAHLIVEVAEEYLDEKLYGTSNWVADVSQEEWSWDDDLTVEDTLSLNESVYVTDEKNSEGKMLPAITSFLNLLAGPDNGIDKDDETGSKTDLEVASTTEENEGRLNRDSTALAGPLSLSAGQEMQLQLSKSQASTNPGEEVEDDGTETVKQGPRAVNGSSLGSTTSRSANEEKTKPIFRFELVDEPSHQEKKRANASFAASDKTSLDDSKTSTSSKAAVITAPTKVFHSRMDEEEKLATELHGKGDVQSTDGGKTDADELMPSLVNMVSSVLNFSLSMEKLEESLNLVDVAYARDPLSSLKKTETPTKKTETPTKKTEMLVKGGRNDVKRGSRKDTLKTEWLKNLYQTGKKHRDMVSETPKSSPMVTEMPAPLMGHVPYSKPTHDGASKDPSEITTLIVHHGSDDNCSLLTEMGIGEGDSGSVVSTHEQPGEEYAMLGMLEPSEEHQGIEQVHEEKEEINQTEPQGIEQVHEEKEEINQAEPDAQPEEQFEVQVEVQAEVQCEVQSEVQVEVQAEVQCEVQSEVQVEVQSVQSEVQPEVQREAKPEVKPKRRKKRGKWSIKRASKWIGKRSTASAKTPR